MYTSGRTVKSKTRKPTTQVSATRDARRIVEKLMPGVGATVNSRTSWDLKADRPTVVTTVTFPRDHEQRLTLGACLVTLPGYVADSALIADSSITITRAV